VANIHNGMLELDPWFALQPVLAESFDVSDDGLEYTFVLRQGVSFHDGEEFTAEDVRYTFDYYRDPDKGTVTAQNFVGIESVEAPDDYTLLVHMAEPNAAFLSRAGQAMIVPAHYHGDVGEDAYKSAAIGTGAFKVKEWRAADYTELEAFEDHFRGRPFLDIFRQDIVPEPSVRAIALDTGEADSSVWALLSEDNIRFLEDSNYTTFVTSALHMNHFPINNEKPYFAEKEVRQAHMYAMDRDELIDGIWLGLAVKATSNLSPALDFYYEPDVKQYPYDPEMAIKLLDEAGWVIGDDGVREKEGQRLSWTCTMITGDVARRAIVEVCQQHFAAVGIEMMIEEAPLATIREGFLQGTIDASHYNSTYGGSSGEPDASVALKSGERSNQSRFSNARVDELCDQGLEETDPDRRREIYSEIQQIVAEEVPFLYIMHWDWFNIFSNRIKGIPEDALTGTEIYRQVHTFWIDEG
jgi:peptide/nickel transport system substrate-binding protein